MSLIGLMSRFGDVIAKGLRKKSGIASSSLMCTLLFGYTYFEGRHLENIHTRHVLAGTTVTVVVEFMTHAIDTLNMQSKVLMTQQSLYLYKFYIIQKVQSIIGKFTGVNAVVWGYASASVIYFYSYGKLKEAFNKSQNGEPSSFWFTLYSSFLASAVAELCCLPIYYPFDLIKTRMQTS